MVGHIARLHFYAANIIFTAYLMNHALDDGQREVDFGALVTL
jgi:hypothetical protein